MSTPDVAGAPSVPDGAEQETCLELIPELKEAIADEMTADEVCPPP